MTEEFFYKVDFTDPEEAFLLFKNGELCYPGIDFIIKKDKSYYSPVELVFKKELVSFDKIVIAHLENNYVFYLEYDSEKGELIDKSSDKVDYSNRNYQWV